MVQHLTYCCFFGNAGKCFRWQSDIWCDQILYLDWLYICGRKIDQTSVALFRQKKPISELIFSKNYSVWWSFWWSTLCIPTVLIDHLISWSCSLSLNFSNIAASLHTPIQFTEFTTSTQVICLDKIKSKKISLALHMNTANIHKECSLDSN